MKYLLYGTPIQMVQENKTFSGHHNLVRWANVTDSHLSGISITTPHWSPQFACFEAALLNIRQQRSMSTSEIMPKRQVLVVGAGGVGTMACVALERSGMASVTAVLRSNYEKVARDGFEIESIDHGRLTAWRPSTGVCHPSIEHTGLTGR